MFIASDAELREVTVQNQGKVNDLMRERLTTPGITPAAAGGGTGQSKSHGGPSAATAGKFSNPEWEEGDLLHTE